VVAVSVEDFKELWESPGSGYVLIQIGEPDENNYIVFNVKTRVAELIDDDEISVQVIEKMKEVGCPILTALPPAL